MPRPNKPHWHEVNRRWRCTIGGRPVDFPREIGRHDRPQIDGVPKAAWDWLEAYKQLLARQAVELADPTVYAVCQRYLQWAEGERDAGRMVAANYRGHEAHLAKFWEWVPPGADKRLGDRPCRQAHPEDLKAFAEAMGADYSAHYVANLCKSVHAAFNWATRRVKGREPEQILAANPFHGYRPPKPPKAAPEDKYLEPSVLRGFLRWAWLRALRGPSGEGRKRKPGVRRDDFLQVRSDLAFVRLLWFLALTGARPGEACTARWENVKWRSEVIVLEEWKNKRKTGRNREIHLTPAVVRLLRTLERLPGRHPDWVFTHRLGRGQAGTAAPTEGAPWDSVALAAKVRAWRQEAKDAELPIVVEGAGRLVAYLLRHTYISDGLMHGMSEAEIADLTGTSAQMVADTYGHIQRQHAARRARELAERRKAAKG